MQDPNQNQPTSQPPAPVVPAVAPLPGQPTMPPVSPNVPPAKSHKGLIFGIIGGAVGLLLLVGALLFFLIALPSLQRVQRSLDTAESFVKAVTTNDTKTAIELANDPSASDYITSSAAKLNGYSYTKTESDIGSPKSYYLYTLTKADTKKYARVVVVKAEASNNYTIGEFTFGDSPLKLKASDTASNDTALDSTPSNTTAKCFAASDYSHAFGWNNTITYTPTLPFTSNAHFNPDSLDYDGVWSQQSVDTVATLVADNPGKDYSIAIRGSVATTAAADKAFANKRAQKVKDQLVAKGVASSKIEIVEPSNVSDMTDDPTNETSQSMARAVVISFLPACSR